MIPAPGQDAYRPLRSRIKEAATWNWSNKARTRLKHVQRPQGGYIQIANADGALVAHVRPKTPADLFYLAEKFTGRLIAWFADDLSAVNMQFINDPPAPKKKRRR